MNNSIEQRHKRHRHIVLDINYIKELMLSQEKTAIIALGDSNNNQDILTLILESNKFTTDALNNINDESQLKEFFQNHNVTIWTNRGIKKDNSISGFPEIKVGTELNSFFDIKEQSAQIIENYNFQQEQPHSTSQQNRLEDFNNSFIYHSDINVLKPTINEFIFQKGKIGGANEGGKEGGIYKRNGAYYLIKQENTYRGVSNHSNISEYLASQIFAATAPGYGAEVFLVSIKSGKIEPDQTGETVYVASKFFNNYQDLYVHAHKTMGKEVPRSRPRNVGTINSTLFNNALKRNNYKYYSGFPQAMVTSLLIADYDVHWGNVGVVSANNENKMVRIDFGWAFKKLYNKLNPHSIVEHLPGFGPTNHFREYPNEMRITQQFADELKRVAKIDLIPCLKQSFENLKQFYGTEPLKEFALSIGIDRKVLTCIKNKNQLSEQILEYMSEKLKSRQDGLKLFGIEIELSLCVNIKTRDFDQQKLQDFINKNPEYCKDIANGKIQIHLRSIESKSFFIELLELLGIITPLAKELEKRAQELIKETLIESGVHFNSSSLVVTL